MSTSNPSNVCLVVLMGLPAAGKSTFCKELNNKSLEKNYKYYRIIYDDVFIGDNLQKYKEGRQNAILFVKNLIKWIASLKDEHIHLITVDDNMYYKSMRYQFFKLAKEAQISFFQLYLKIDMESALTRNSKRKNKVPEHVIKEMGNKLEEPGKEMWEHHSLTLDSNQASDFKDFFLMVEKCLNEPIRSYEVDKHPVLLTRLQKIELLLRKIVHEQVTKNEAPIKQLLLKKKQIHQQIKIAKIVIDEDLVDLALLDYLRVLFNTFERG